MVLPLAMRDGGASSSGVSSVSNYHCALCYLGTCLKCARRGSILELYCTVHPVLDISRCSRITVLSCPRTRGLTQISNQVA